HVEPPAFKVRENSTYEHPGFSGGLPLDDNITTEVVEGIATLKHELDPETTQVVFKDAGFADSVVKTNAIQILKQAGIDDVKSI
ncbi:hypothetical protein, partial [Aeromonas sp. QDB01]|uniref:hypothetical protein n=1 Tax=Aeromonas sp. QDB01 TaxID=2990475 RepID=UPI0022E13691